MCYVMSFDVYVCSLKCWSLVQQARLLWDDKTWPGTSSKTSSKRVWKCNQVIAWQSRSLYVRVWIFRCHCIHHGHYMSFYHKSLLVPASSSHMFNLHVHPFYCMRIENWSTNKSLLIFFLPFRIQNGFGGSWIEAKGKERWHSRMRYPLKTSMGWENKTGTTVHRLCTK